MIFSCIFIAGCNQKTSESENAKSMKTPPDKAKSKEAGFESEHKVQEDNLADFNKLSPIEILNPESKDVYEKYGIEFSGNCYACDLAAIRINKKHFDLVNVCEQDDFYRTEKFNYEVQPDRLIIRTEKNELIFTKIEAAPVYELKIAGDKISLKNKRISKFYTPEIELIKFKQHDCGEFDG